MTRALYLVDAFTRTRLRGNPAGVVADARGLDGETMRAIAREVNAPATAFVEDSDGDVVNIRFFTPHDEIPICGHATIAAHYVRASLNGAATARQRCGAGEMSVRTFAAGGDFRVELDQGVPAFGPSLDAGTESALLDALGLDPADRDEQLPIEVVSTGNPKLFVAVRLPSTLNALQPEPVQLAAIARGAGATGVFVFTRNPESADVLFECRMFGAVSEDPVTGTANAALGGYAVKHALIGAGARSFWSLQGRRMRREGRVLVHVDAGSRVSIAGDAVISFAGTLSLDSTPFALR